ncbi:hypothetical protein HN832_01295 [archaeon]|jgi:hypothetical protein|nr:hypothetical protein [archaeon]MBT4373907.1 hypothetical protein [archaeon]MBT4532184.1 hypothetical protein [archaeon]MBT7001137.1 hypothetical protein [archaeon]MBT7282026.1 hypothetical protein [archaeon]
MPKKVYQCRICGPEFTRKKRHTVLNHEKTPIWGQVLEIGGIYLHFRDPERPLLAKASDFAYITIPLRKRDQYDSTHQIRYDCIDLPLKKDQETDRVSLWALHEEPELMEDYEMFELTELTEEEYQRITQPSIKYKKEYHRNLTINPGMPQTNRFSIEEYIRYCARTNEIEFSPKTEIKRGIILDKTI